MKTLIVYATKYGATKKIVEKLAGYMGEEATAYNIAENHGIKPDDYDCVVIGSPLTAGAVKKEIKEFAQNNLKKLQDKKVGIFVSGLSEEGLADYLRNNFPKELLAGAKATAFLGGVFDPDKCGLFARTIIKMVSKLDKYTSNINEEKIMLFAQELMEE